MTKTEMIDATETLARTRRRHFVERATRLRRVARSQIATPKTMVLGVGAGFALERMGHGPNGSLNLFRTLKNTWLSWTGAAAATAAAAAPDEQIMRATTGSG
jgi:hypothetical protein